MRYEHGSAYALQVHLTRHGIDGNLMKLDTHIGSAFVKCSMRSHRDDPARVVNPTLALKERALTSRVR